MSMVSYARNGEDVVLWRLFKNQLFGRYIDIGAAEPVEDSVTKHFYDRGWRGVNVEPDPTHAAALMAVRTEDVNLTVAVSDREGTATLHVGARSQHGLATLETEVAERVLGAGSTTVEVETITLASLVERYIPGPVDFIKVNVEGHEKEVIAGGRWDNFRPRVVVVQSTLPNTTVPSHERWEAMLLDVSYCCVLFDGLNRFYALEDDLEARATLSAPANAMDQFVRWDLVQRAEELYELQVTHRACASRIAELERRIAASEQFSWTSATRADTRADRTAPRATSQSDAPATRSC